MEPDLLCESPVTDVAPRGSEQVFDDVMTSRLFEVVEALNHSAGAASEHAQHALPNSAPCRTLQERR